MADLKTSFNETLIDPKDLLKFDEEILALLNPSKVIFNSNLGYELWVCSVWRKRLQFFGLQKLVGYVRSPGKHRDFRVRSFQLWSYNDLPHDQLPVRLWESFGPLLPDQHRIRSVFLRLSGPRDWEDEIIHFLLTRRHIQAPQSAQKTRHFEDWE